MKQQTIFAVFFFSFFQRAHFEQFTMGTILFLERFGSSSCKQVLLNEIFLGSEKLRGFYFPLC